VAVIALFVVIIIVLAAVLYFVVLPILTEEEKAKICGSDIDESSRVWLEVIVDRVDPDSTRLVLLAESYISDVRDYLEFIDTLDLLTESEEEDYVVGKAQKYEWIGRTFLSAVFFAGCSLEDQNAHTYEEEMIGGTLRLVILIALQVVSPEAAALFISFQIILDFISFGDEYALGDSTLGEGTDIQGIDQGDFPDRLDGRDKDKFIRID
jgi:hypothetical protein